MLIIIIKKFKMRNILFSIPGAVLGGVKMHIQSLTNMVTIRFIDRNEHELPWLNYNVSPC